LNGRNLNVFYKCTKKDGNTKEKKITIGGNFYEEGIARIQLSVFSGRCRKLQGKREEFPG